MKQKKKDIFTDLYKEHSSQMYGLCLRYTKNPQDAEDVLQEGFLNIYSALDGFKGEANIKTWIRKIMVNTAINHYRQKIKIDYKVIDKEDSEIFTVDNEDIITKMSEDELLEVINQLPDGYRIIFNMHTIEGYKHREIAEILGISEGTSKSQLAKAKKVVKEWIASKLGLTKENVKFITI